MRKGEAHAFEELASVTLSAGASWRWLAPSCGMFLAEFATGGEIQRRPLAVAAADWAVCQITVGAFTSEDFADIIHGAGLAADYYVRVVGQRPAPAFTAGEQRWRDYERLHGDAIHPHVMARDVGSIAPELAHDDPNWDSLTLEGIEARLRRLQRWWAETGFAPLDRIATYTPSNPFVEACRRVGIGVVHSLVPEQNWSDGEWSINHWGMPTCPFWIAPDDFRKAGRRTAGGVLGMTMNHYHVVIPHLTHWGDFVLSPSHFTRWIRAADAGAESVRFRQFLTDTVQGGVAFAGEPFFFCAGFEFGRTFGTSNMTPYNRHGLERLVALARTERLVFATSRDVRAYHERHVPGLAERAFRQRDYWVGLTVNGKPGQAGDSVVVERGDYKAAIREGENLPMFYYDYLEQWDFAPRDTQAPADFAPACKQALSVRLVAPDHVVIEALQPLVRTVPVVIWDAAAETPESFSTIRLAPLDDGRTVSVWEVPNRWSGRVEVALSPVARPARRQQGSWELQTFRGTEDGVTYLYLAAPLTRAVRLPVRLGKTARVDGATRELGMLPAGVHRLEFGPLQSWYRFWGCGVDDVDPAEGTETLLAQSGALLTPEWPALVEVHARELNALARAHPAAAGRQPIYGMLCGGDLPLGTRSRAASHDRVLIDNPLISSQEFGDGAIAFGPGRAFWYHPRGISFKIEGLNRSAGAAGRWTILLHTFDPLGLNVRYRVMAGENVREAGTWEVPVDAGAEQAFYAVTAEAGDLDARGRLQISLRTDQTQVLDWWKDKGFIAAVHAFWVFEG